jgi:hypothetical protein
MRPTGVREKRVHGGGGDEDPERDEVVDLPVAGELEPEQQRRLGAVGGDAFLAAEEAVEDQRRGGHELGHRERHHREDRARA